MTESEGTREIAKSQKQIGQLMQAGRFNSASRRKIGADISDRFGSSASDNPHLRPRPFVVPSGNQAPTERKRAAAGKHRAGADHKLQEADHKLPEAADHNHPEAADHTRPEAAADNIQEAVGSSQAAGCLQWRCR
jgi:hypothetical protein